MTRSFQEFCRQFTDKELPHVVRIGKRHYYDPQGLLRQAGRWDVFSVGLYLGEERREYLPTSGLLELLFTCSQAARITLSEKSAALYLYGRDVLMEGAVPSGAEPGQLVFVTDGQRLLGYGKVTHRYDRRLRNKVFVKNLLDKGEYLRRER